MASTGVRQSGRKRVPHLVHLELVHHCGVGVQHGRHRRPVQSRGGGHHAHLDPRLLGLGGEHVHALADEGDHGHVVFVHLQNATFQLIKAQQIIQDFNSCATRWFDVLHYLRPVLVAALCAGNETFTKQLQPCQIMGNEGKGWIK